VNHAIAADLGKAPDATAVCVLRRVEIPTGEYNSHREEIVDYRLELQAMKTLDPHPDYERLAHKLVDLCFRLAPRWGFGEMGEIALAVDARGPGETVIDIIANEISDRPFTTDISLYAVKTTNGSGVNRTGVMWGVPKTTLVHMLYQELVSGRLRLGREGPGREVEATVDELINYRMQYTAQGNTIYNPLLSTQHDDRHDALALGCWTWSLQPLSNRQLPETTWRYEDRF
jgi:hypothetical protein